MPKFDVLGEGQFRWRANERLLGGILMLVGVALGVFGISTLGTGEQGGNALFVGCLSLLVVFAGLFYWRRCLEVQVGPDGHHWWSRTLFRSRKVSMPGVRVAAVRLRVEVRGDKFDASMIYRGPYFLYLVDLILEPESLVTTQDLLSRRRELPARRRAKQIAVELGVPFVDAIGDTSVNLAPQGANAESAPTRIDIVQEGAERAVRLRGLMPWSSLGVLSVAWVINLGISLLVRSGLAEDLPKFVDMATVFMIAMQGTLTLWLLAGLFGGTRIAVGHGVISVATSVLGMPLKTRQLPIAEIENLRVQTFHPLRRGFAMVLPRKTLLVARRYPTLALWELHAWLTAELNLQNRSHADLSGADAALALAPSASAGARVPGRWFRG